MPDASPLATPAVRSGKGVFVVVLGPSGVGKDSLIAHARKEFAGDNRVMFVRRVVTRESNLAEDHDTMDAATFDQAERDGSFAVTWQAHGLRYGIPGAVHAHLARGGVAIANGSRAAVGQIRSAFDHVVVVSITARPEVIAARLAGRGRETAEEIGERLRRTASIAAYPDDAVEIDNSGDLSDAGQRLVATIERLLSR